jgi:hypothetical protein
MKNKIENFDRIKMSENGYVVIESELRKYLTCPVNLVKCSEEILINLAKEIEFFTSVDKTEIKISCKNNDDNFPDKLWINSYLEEFSIKPRIEQVINNEYHTVFMDKRKLKSGEYLEGMPFDFLYEKFQKGLFIDETMFIFTDDLFPYECWIGYCTQFGNPPYWIGDCDTEDDDSRMFETAEELFNAKLYKGKSLKECWNTVKVIQVEGMCLDCWYECQYNWFRDEKDNS